MILRNGSEAALSGTTLAAVPTLGGEVVGDELADFSDQEGIGVTGTVQTRVVRTAAGTLDFYFRVTRLSGGDVNLMTYRFFGTTLSTDTDFRMDGLGAVGPSRAERRDLAAYDIVDLNYVFAPALSAGSESRFVFVKTDATDFRRDLVLSMYGWTPMWLAGTRAFFAR